MQEEGLAPHSAQQGATAMGATALTGALPPVFHKLLPMWLPSQGLGFVRLYSATRQGGCSAQCPAVSSRQSAYTVKG